MITCLPVTWASLFAGHPALASDRSSPIPSAAKGCSNQREQMGAFVEAGGLLQLTLGSLIGTHGFMMRWHSRGLLKRHPTACVIASDSHNLAARAPLWNKMPDAWRHLIPVGLAEVERWGRV
jgi:hypothetical protein